DRMERGHGRRCSGYREGRFVYCSREQHAGSLTLNGAGLYCHLAQGPCKCGVEHTPDPEVMHWEIRDPAGHLVATHYRRNLGNGGKTYWWGRHGQKGLG